MMLPASDEISEALGGLHTEREAIRSEVEAIERDLADRHEALERLTKAIETLERLLERPDADSEPPDSEFALPERPAPPPPVRPAPRPPDRYAEPAAPPDLSGIPRLTAVLGLLAGSDAPLHYKEIAEIASAPTSSVTPNLSSLKQRDLVETSERGSYRLVTPLPIESEQEANEALRVVVTTIVDEQRWDILEAIFEMDNRLPFVGFEHFRRNRLPGVAGVRWANDRLTHEMMKELIARELVEVYHTDNPRNPDFPTAALRLTDEGFDEIER